jgi:hypothetical protein
MVNEIAGSNNSLGTEEAVSEKLVNLLRCLGVGDDYTDVETAEASIKGFEVVSQGREKYTVKDDKILLIINS